MKRIKNDFPALGQKIYGKPLVYLDSGASSLKPQTVIDAVSEYYASINSNVHRGAHHLSNRATEAYENARKRVQKYGEVRMVSDSSCKLNIHQNAKVSNLILFRNFTPSQPGLLYQGLKNGKKKKKKKERKEKCTAGADYI